MVSVSLAVRNVWPACLELAPQVAVVVDLAVEDDPDGAILVADRLLAVVEIDDAQPPHAEATPSPR
jgi:hypothetical protein